MAFGRRADLFISMITIINLCIYCCFGSEINSDVSRVKAKNDFDLLIFTQRWPITDCMTWMNRGEDHVCMLPSQKDTWVIHGIWPTKLGKLGPFFCNSSSPFDINTLEPLMDQLKQYWINIEKGTPEASLWNHEWTKHGTCASVLSEMSTENKYFGQGLAWLQQYTMNGLLSKSNVVPGAEYGVVDFHNAVKNNLNINPSIHCVREKNHNGEQLLSEIKVCFNHNLELINCDGILGMFGTRYQDGVITNCDSSKQIQYPNEVPQHLRERMEREPNKMVWRFPWVNLYKLVQLLKWLTL